MTRRLYQTTSVALFALLSVTRSHAALDLVGGSTYIEHTDDDLTSFVTRPEIKAPRYKVTYKAADVTPGYWFVAPYADIKQPPHPAGYYHPCSTGPNIYDGNGDLVWSGACQSRDQNACDFRRHVDQDGNERLSALYVGWEREWQSQAIIMNSSFETLYNYTNPVEEPRINMHELIVVNDGRSAIYIAGRSDLRDISELHIENQTVGWVSDYGIREIEIPSGRTIFEWWTKDKISLRESVIPPNFEELLARTGRGWNWFHANSVDKNDVGEYLLSGRFADTIYKIAPTGEIVWRLGGIFSSFELDNFNFSKQHDARFVSHVGHIETVSFFDNAEALHPGLDLPGSSNTSSALVVEIDHNTKRAKVIRRIWRPDGGLTRLRGNYQRLGNGHDFISWAGNSYISEHDEEGNLLLEAQWVSKRFVTYRAYKHNFTSYPTEPPVLKVMVFGETADTSTTVWYTSWNGATELSAWRFYRASNSTTGQEGLVGEKGKTGFETTFISDGAESKVYAEAIASDGTVLGRTDVHHIPCPTHWHSTVETKQDWASAGSDGTVQLSGARIKDEL